MKEKLLMKSVCKPTEVLLEGALELRKGLSVGTCAGRGFSKRAAINELWVIEWKTNTIPTRTINSNG